MTAVLTSDRPAVRDNLEFLEPQVATGRWTIHNPSTGKYSRLSKSAIDFLNTLDGNRTVHEITTAASSSAEMPTAAVQPLLASFESLGLLTTSEATKPKADGKRLTFKPPFTVQVTVLRSPSWLGPGSLAARIAGFRHTPAILATLAVAGFLALVSQGGDLVRRIESCDGIITPRCVL